MHFLSLLQKVRMAGFVKNALLMLVPWFDSIIFENMEIVNKYFILTHFQFDIFLTNTIFNFCLDVGDLRRQCSKQNCSQFKTNFRSKEKKQHSRRSILRTKRYFIRYGTYLNSKSISGAKNFLNQITISDPTAKNLYLLNKYFDDDQ